MPLPSRFGVTQSHHRMDRNLYPSQERPHLQRRRVSVTIRVDRCDGDGPICGGPADVGPEDIGLDPIVDHGGDSDRGTRASERSRVRRIAVGVIVNVEVVVTGD